MNLATARILSLMLRFITLSPTKLSTDFVDNFLLEPLTTPTFKISAKSEDKAALVSTK
jgi:hypothetical protein